MVGVAVFPWGPHPWAGGLRWPQDCAEPPLAPPGGCLLDPWVRLPSSLLPHAASSGTRAYWEFCVFICSAPTAGPAPCQAVF